MDRRRPTEGPGLPDREGKPPCDRVRGMRYLAAALVLLTASVILGLMAVPGREPSAKWKIVDSRGETVARNAVDFIEIEGLSREEADEMLRIFGWSVEPADPRRGDVLLLRSLRHACGGLRGKGGLSAVPEGGFGVGSAGFGRTRKASCRASLSLPRGAFEQGGVQKTEKTAERGRNMKILIGILMTAATGAAALLIGRGIAGFLGGQEKKRYYVDEDPDIQTNMHGRAEE